MTIAIALIVVAFMLVVVEMAFPSFGLLSLGAATAYTFALIHAFEAGPTTGLSFVGAGIVLLPLAISIGLKWLPKSPFGRRVLLSGPAPENIQRGTLPAEALRLLIGVEGVAASDLRPSGIAEIEGRRIDVVVDRGYVARGSRIVVLDANGARVVVRAL